LKKQKLFRPAEKRKGPGKWRAPSEWRKPRVKSVSGISLSLSLSLVNLENETMQNGVDLPQSHRAPMDMKKYESPLQEKILDDCALLFTSFPSHPVYFKILSWVNRKYFTLTDILLSMKDAKIE
jgi:hypothetical protein